MIDLRVGWWLELIPRIVDPKQMSLMGLDIRLVGKLLWVDEPLFDLEVQYSDRVEKQTFRLGGSNELCVRISDRSVWEVGRTREPGAGDLPRLV